MGIAFIKQDARRIGDMVVEFATQVAPQLMTGTGRDPEKVKQFADDMEYLNPRFFGPIFHYHLTPSIWMGANHPNCQVDNAYFWKDEHGSMDCGLFDWSGFGRCAIVLAMWGCLAGMYMDLLDAHEEGLLRLFCDEHERYGGKRLDLEELQLRFRLMAVVNAMGSGVYLERDIYIDLPKDQWADIESAHSEKFSGKFQVRARATGIINILDYWGRRPMRQMAEEFMAGKGAPYFKLMEGALSASYSRSRPMSFSQGERGGSASRRNFLSSQDLLPSFSGAPFCDK